MTIPDPQTKEVSPSPPSGPAITRRQAYISFAIVSVALLMASIDSTIVAVSLPTMLVDLKTNLAWIGWMLTGYLFSQSIIMPLAGKLSDEHGRKRVFLVAVGIFTLSSIAAGFAPNVHVLIVFRVLQGIGGGAFLPSATGIVCDAFAEKRAAAIGLFGSVFPIGGILGPNIGGLIIAHASWRWIFFVNVPIGAALMICGILFLPRGTHAATGRGLDWTGAGLFAAGMLSVLFAMTNWADNPEGFNLLTPALFLSGAAILALFVRHESRVTHPMIDIKLLRWRPIAAANVLNFFLGTVMFGLVSFIPYYATIAYNMTAEETGFLLTPRSIVMIASSFITSMFIIRLRYRTPMIVGLAIIMFGLVLMSRGFHDVTIFGQGINNFALLAIVITVSGLGMGLLNPAANNAVLDLVPDKAAAITGVRGMFRISGGMVGTTGVVLALSHFKDKVAGMEILYIVFSVLLLLMVPIVFMIPDHANVKGKSSTRAESTHSG